MYNIGAQLRGQVERDRQSALQNILLELEEELIACNLLDELAWIDRVELHREVQLVDVFILFELAREACVGIEPVLWGKMSDCEMINDVNVPARSPLSHRLSFEVQIPEAEVSRLEEIEPREDDLEQRLSQ